MGLGSVYAGVTAEARSEVGMNIPALKVRFRRNCTFLRIFENFDLGHPMPSETGRDNSDHIPIMFVDSGTPVAVLVTDPDVPRGPCRSSGATSDQPPWIRRMSDFLVFLVDGFPKLSKNPIPKMEIVQSIPVPKSQRDRSPGAPHASRSPAACRECCQYRPYRFAGRSAVPHHSDMKNDHFHEK